MSNTNERKWKVVSVKDGLRTVEVADFAEFIWLTQRYFGEGDFIWRGRRDAAWEVASSLARTGSDSSRVLHWFRDAVARCTLTDYDIEGSSDAVKAKKLRLWSLGQHHGLATPLVDWTAYPFIALFFAVAEPGGDEAGRAVYALSWGDVRPVNFNLVEPRIKQFKRWMGEPILSEDAKNYLHAHYENNFDEPGDIDASKLTSEGRKRLTAWELQRLRNLRLQIFRPRNSENPRIHGQGGVHVFTDEDITLEEWGRRHWPHARSAGAFVTKLVIPATERINILSSLNAMNINYLSLFPDLDGAARHCNLIIKERFRNNVRGY